MAFDFNKFPELTNAQMQFYYFVSPHRQITESFNGRCDRVIDGDTISVQWSERDFNTTVRLALINAPELNREGGRESKAWLESKILGKEIHISVDPDKRIGKFGRILGEIIHQGININLESMGAGQSNEFR